MRLTSEQEDFVAAIRDYCQRTVGTKEQRDALTKGGTDHHNPDVYEEMAQLGWVGVGIPEEYGGAGAGMVETCLFLEHTAHGMAPIHGYASTAICAGPYEKFGSEEQRQEVLTGIAAGVIEAVAMSEPGAGSDVAGLICRADRTDGGYVINGQKTWVSNAHMAAHVLLVCRTEKGDRHDGLSMLCVPAGQEGMEVSPIDTMDGSCVVNDVFFSDCEVPAEALVGTEGKAWRQLTAGLNLERLICAADSLGKAQRAFDDTLAYVKEREQFGRPIGSFQALKHRLADLATEIECARLLLYDVAAKVDEQPDRLLPREASMAKLKASEVANRCSLEGLRMMGGYGYATEYEMEQHVRRSLVGTIYGGTSEIQRDIIGKTLGL